MRIRDLDIKGNSITFMGDDENAITDAVPVNNFKEIYPELMNNPVEDINQLFTNIVAFSADSEIYACHNDVGLIMTNELARKANENGIRINSRKSLDNKKELIDLTSLKIIAGYSHEIDSNGGTYYFICQV